MGLISIKGGGVVAAVAAVLLLQATPATAHARYEGSSPGDGETVGSPPSQVQADFSEPVTSDSYLEVTDPCGEVVSGASEPVADKVTVSMSGSRSGTYSVYYRVQSTVDSHVTDGSFTFTSSGGDPCPGAEPEPRDGGGNDPGENPGGPGDGSEGDDPGSGGSEDTSSDPADTSSDVTTDDESGDIQRSGSGNGKGQGGGNKKGGSGSNGDGGGGGELELSLQNEERERRGPDPWDLPRDGLIAGLLIAAAIGAAGGRIYASIVGPRA
jgi:methionine-rich copper-binding protein CopC